MYLKLLEPEGWGTVFKDGTKMTLVDLKEAF